MIHFYILLLSKIKSIILIINNLDTHMQDTNTPRFVPAKCPVCNGFGSVKHGQLICGSCNGKGVIVIDQNTGLSVEQTNNYETKKS